MKPRPRDFIFTAARAKLKIYLRDAEHIEAVKRIIEAEFPGLGGTLFLNAEICRKELLIEIEAACLSRLKDNK